MWKNQFFKDEKARTVTVIPNSNDILREKNKRETSEVNESQGFQQGWMNGIM